MNSIKTPISSATESSSGSIDLGCSVVIKKSKVDFLRILNNSGFTIGNFVNELRKNEVINLNIESHGISYPVSARIIKEGIDLVGMTIQLNAISHVPKNLVKSPHKANFGITDSTVFGKVRLDLNDNIVFGLENIENGNIYKVRQSRRIILTSTERFLNKYSIDGHHLETYNVAVDGNNGVVHDLSTGGVGVFLNVGDDFFDNMIQSGGDTIAYNLDFLLEKEKVETKIKIVNMRPIDDSGAVRLGGQFIDISPKTEDKIYKLILDAERKALQKIKAQY